MILLFLIGATIVEIGTIAASMVIIGKGSIEGLFKLYDEGYKLSNDINLEEELEIISTKVTLNLDKSFLSAFDKIALIIPGLNVLDAKLYNYRYSKEIKNVIDELLEDGLIVPMSDLEKDNYSYMNDLTNKLLFLDFQRNKKYDEEVIDIVGDFVITTDTAIKPVYKRIPSEYTLDEVLMLNEKINNSSYRLGYSNGKALAIIGLQSDDFDFKRISVPSGKSYISYDFDELPNDKGKDIFYSVYLANEETSELVKCYEELLEKRKVKEETNDVIYYELTYNEKIEMLKELIQNDSFSDDEIDRLKKDLDQLESEYNDENIKKNGYAKKR